MSDLCDLSSLPYALTFAACLFRLLAPPPLLCNCDTISTGCLPSLIGLFHVVICYNVAFHFWYIINSAITCLREHLDILSCWQKALFGNYSVSFHARRKTWRRSHCRGCPVDCQCCKNSRVRTTS